MAYIDSANIKGTLYELQDTQARTDIGDLKSAVGINEENYISSDYEQGTISSSTGESSGTNANRVRLVSFLSYTENVRSVFTKSGYAMFVYGYNADKQYIGAYTANQDFVVGGNNARITSFDLNDYPAYFFRFVVVMANNGNLTPADASQNFVYSTDDILKHENEIVGLTLFSDNYYSNYYEQLQTIEQAGIVTTSNSRTNSTSTDFFTIRCDVTPGNEYTISGYAHNSRYALYYWMNSANTIESYDANTCGAGNKTVIATAPSNSSYIIINTRKSINPGWIMGTVEKMDYGLAKSSPLFGKKVSWYGDSIIQNGWWSTVSKTFEMDSTNNGVGGTKISGSDVASLCQRTRIEGEYADVVDPNTGEITHNGIPIPADADYIIIGAGTNDWAQSIQLGEKNVIVEDGAIVEDVSTFYQACHVMFRRLAELRPNAKIIVLGTPFAKMAQRTGFPDTYGLVNGQNLTAIDYGNALCDVAEMWGHFALRYGTYMGINDNNCDTYLPKANGSNSNLHPTSLSGKMAFAAATLNGLARIKFMV